MKPKRLFLSLKKFALLGFGLDWDVFPFFLLSSFWNGIYILCLSRHLFGNTLYLGSTQLTWFYRFTAGGEFSSGWAVSWVSTKSYLDEILKFTLKRVKTFVTVGLEWMYFACKNDMDFGGPGQNVWAQCLYPSKIHFEALPPKCDVTKRWGLWGYLGLDEVIKVEPPWWD